MMFGIPLTATALKYSVLANIGLTLLLLGSNGWQQYRVMSAQLETAGVEAKLAGVEADIAKQRLAFEAAARETEKRHQKVVAEITDTYAKEMADAKLESDVLVADLESGARRLRAHWQGCVATTELSRAAGAAAVADGGAELRAADSGRLARTGAEADAKVRALQAYITGVLRPPPG